MRAGAASERPGEPIPVGTVTTLSDVYAYEPLPTGLTDVEAARECAGC